MIRRRVAVRRILAVGVLVTSWGLALASIVIAWVFQLPELPVAGAFLSASPPLVQSRFDEIGVVVALIYGLLSAVLLLRRPHPVVVVLAVHAVGSGIAAFGVQWGLLGERVPDLPLWGLLAHAAGWGYIPGTVGTVIVPVILLRKPLGAAGRTVVTVVVALAAVSWLAAVVHQAPLDPVTGGPINPFAIRDAATQAILPWIYGVAVVLAVLISVGVAVWVVMQWRQATADRRARVGWLTVGHAFLTLSYAALVVPADPEIPALLWDFGMIAPVIGQIFYPSAVLVLVLGTRLRGIDLAVTRVLLWTILTVAAITAYLIVSELLTAVTSLDPVAIGILSAAIVAIPLQAARRGSNSASTGSCMDRMVTRHACSVGSVSGWASSTPVPRGSWLSPQRCAARSAWRPSRSCPTARAPPRSASGGSERTPWPWSCAPRGHGSVRSGCIPGRGAALGQRAAEPRRARRRRRDRSAARARERAARRCPGSARRGTAGRAPHPASRTARRHRALARGRRLRACRCRQPPGE
ncbi:hypothetical protein [Homoserinibacter gongjuensis]|uniref:Integral membrane protein n=1 Tax=Homoserinibacter gongjuensis TaxID=1162968 RepID=A0ABQ6JSF9_9MICO|nr:hypothetical protein [Homoserinibacter gongjuensis]GMA91241.1 hypothetical protein GCM10025869_17700 [Homoserinibacter gongjuensis]